MNTVAAEYGLKRRHVLAIRILESVAKALSMPKAMEFFMSLYATVYGLALTVFGSQALAAMGFKSNILPLEMTNMFGALVMMSGVMGIYGLWKHRQAMRLICAMGMAVIWGSLAIHYMFAQPPIQTASVVHGFHSVMEAVIFLRVFANLDNYWKE